MPDYEVTCSLAPPCHGGTRIAGTVQLDVVEQGPHPRSFSICLHNNRVTDLIDESGERCLHLEMLSGVLVLVVGTGVSVLSMKDRAQVFGCELSQTGISGSLDTVRVSGVDGVWLVVSAKSVVVVSVDTSDESVVFFSYNSRSIVRGVKIAADRKRLVFDEIVCRHGVEDWFQKELLLP